MKNKMKPIYSLIAVFLFLTIALGSFGPDASTNTTVAPKNCKDTSTVAGQLLVKVSVEGWMGTIVPFSSGELFIVHQEAVQDGCTANVLSSTRINFSTDKEGYYTYSGFNWTHNNLEDLIRVELELYDLSFGFYREVIVYKYDIPTFDFEVTVLPAL